MKKTRGDAMAMSVKEFLSLYFRQLHFNAMPDAIRTQFDEYVAKNSFRGDMKSWRDDLLKKDGSGNPYRDPPKTGHYAVADFPGDAAMEEASWLELYSILWNTFNKMDANRDSLNKDTVKFLDEFFGERKTFKPIELDDPTKQGVQEFYNKVLNTTDAAENNAIFDLYQRALGDDVTPQDFDNFKHAIKNGTYEKNQSVRQKLRKFIASLKNQYEYSFYSQQDNGPVATKIRENIPLLDTITAGLSRTYIPQTTDVPNVQADIRRILTALHKNDKIAADFKQADNGKISNILEDAIKKTDYTGKITEKDYVPEKYPDHKNVFQRIDDKRQDIYDNVFKRFVTFHRDHIYKIPSAKAVTEAIVSAGVKPTDGIEGILAKKDDVIKKLQNKIPLESLDQFKWFVSKMEQFQKGKMSEAVKGALREGPKMNRLVEALAWDAIEETNNGKNRIEDTKAIMEMLTVMSYGTFNSRRLDALRGTDVKIFGDEKLSWNKNEGINTVMKGLDKTIHFATFVAGAGITAAANRIRKIGTSFNHSGKLEDAHKKWQAQNTADYALAENEKNTQDAADDAEIANQTAILNGTGIADDTALVAKQAQLTADRANEQTLKTAYEDAVKEQNKALAIQRAYGSRDMKLDDRNRLMTEKSAIENELRAKPDTLANQLERAEVNAKQIEYKKVLRDLQKVEDEIKQINEQYSNALDAEYARITTPNPATGRNVLRQLEDDVHRAFVAYRDAERDNDTLEKNISDYASAKSEIAFYENCKSERQAHFDKWDEDHKDYYAELMGFWDFMQTGKTKGLFYISKKGLQKRYDKIRKDGKSKMTKMYDDWIKSHGYAA